VTVLPEVYVPPLRIGADAVLASTLLIEPMVFASHFALVADLVTWPADITAVIERVRRRYSRHDAVLSLMETLRNQLPIPISAELAKRIAEGLEVRTALRATPMFYRDACRSALSRLLDLQAGSQASDDTASGRLARLGKLMAFSPTEMALLTYAVAYTIMPELQLFTQLAIEDRWRRQDFWQVALDTSTEVLAAALSPRGRLIGSGLLRARAGIPVLSEFWVEWLIKTDTDFTDSLVQPFAPRESPDGASRLPPEDREIVEALLQRDSVGINVLVYGKSAVDKRHLCSRLIREAGGTAYGLNPDIPQADLSAAVMVAQQLLRGTAHAVLVVEKSQAILSRALPELFALFGMSDEEDAEPLDARILAENPVPTLWLAGETRRFHPDTLARFLFHAEVLKGSRADRQAMVESLIARLPVATRHKAELVKLEGLSEQQVLAARRVADLTAGRSRKVYARHLLVAATRSQKALDRRGKDEARLPVTRYSLEYIHATGRFGPAQILKAFRHRPHGSLCLYGLPGTGKTQFAEHLARELSKPILIKRASEILDKYLGESEKRIAEAFDQAEEDGAILLLDEADSFLRDRNRSSHSWEVTTVNELLQRMERFEGIFVCTTNLYAQLDIAALRRFTFKLEFLPLTQGQRWAMFLNETGLLNKVLSPKRQGEYEERLLLMRDLTSGDFATVKRQCLLLGETLSPEEWLDQLDMEVRAKRRGDDNEIQMRLRG
jgi:hypothetical protein